MNRADEMLIEALRALRRADVESAPLDATLDMKACPTPAVLGMAARHGIAFLSEAEREHLAQGCPLCERALLLLWQEQCPSEALLAEYAVGDSLVLPALTAHVSSCAEAECVRARNQRAGLVEHPISADRGFAERAWAAVLASLEVAFGNWTPDSLPAPAYRSARHRAAAEGGGGSAASEASHRSGVLESAELAALGLESVYEYRISRGEDPAALFIAVDFSPVDRSAPARPLELEIVDLADGSVISSQPVRGTGRVRRATFESIVLSDRPWTSIGVRLSASDTPEPNG